MNHLPKVLFINHSVRDGGPGRSLFYILKYIDKDKIDPYVLIPKDDVFSDMLRSEGLGNKIIIESKFPENILRPRFKEDKQISSNKSANLSSKLLKILSVSFNILELLVLIISSPFLIRKKKANLIYCNGTLAKITGAFIGLINWRPVIWHVRNIQQTKVLLATVNFLSLFPVIKKIICVSDAVAKQFRLSKNKITVIHNGIDLEDFNPERSSGVLRSEFNIPESEVIVGSVGRIVPRKGYENLIKSASYVYKRLSEEKHNIKFVVVGDTPYYFRHNHLESLKGLVKELGLDDNFIFTGYKKDIRPYLRDFDIFVITSNYPDPFPRTVIEAMAFAIPVVGFRVGGVVEAVKNNETGFLCEAGNITQMGESILRLINDQVLRQTMGNSGRERAGNLFSAKVRTKDVEDSILEVAK